MRQVIATEASAEHWSVCYSASEMWCQHDPVKIRRDMGEDQGPANANVTLAQAERCDLITKRVPKLNDVVPQAWLADVLARLRDQPASRIFEMLPWNWKAARLAIATYYPPIAPPRSACEASQMHMRVQCTTRLVHGLQLNERGPSHMCAHPCTLPPNCLGDVLG
jgi:IS66 C-terminal element